jgi:hypothetical protein
MRPRRRRARRSEAAGDPALAGDHRQRLVLVGRAYVRWAMEDPAVAHLAFGAGAPGPDADISPHPHDVLDAELDRLVDAGALPASSRPGAEFVLWVAIHGLATLLADGSMSLDDRDAVDREVERVVRTVLAGLEQEEPSSPWSNPRSSHTERRERKRSRNPDPTNDPQLS